jgi:hypothetical protein
MFVNCPYNWSNPGITCALGCSYVVDKFSFLYKPNENITHLGLPQHMISFHRNCNACFSWYYFVGHCRKEIYTFWTRDNTADFIKRLQNARDFRLPPHVFEALTLQGCYAGSICKLLQTFRDSLWFAFTRVKHLWMAKTLIMRLIGLGCFTLEYFTDRLYRNVGK